MDEYKTSNRIVWDAWARFHVESDHYDNDSFRAGRNTLRSIERDALPDVAGKSLLHLQCHFGQDTLSWARLGADVTGADFSVEAINTATEMSKELGLHAKFVCCDLYDLPNQLDKEFDIVFTSYGIKCWLSDMPAWGKIAAQYLKPGGTFFMVEHHPLLDIFDDGDPKLRVEHDYFHSQAPDRYETTGSYAGRMDEAVPAVYEWTHSLSDIIGALLDAGLRIESFQEYPICGYACFPFMELGDDGWYRLPKEYPSLPFMFSVQATRPE